MQENDEYIKLIADLMDLRLQLIIINKLILIFV